MNKPMVAPAYSQLDLHKMQALNPGLDIFAINEDGTDSLNDNYQEGLHAGEQAQSKRKDACGAIVEVHAAPSHMHCSL